MDPSDYLREVSNTLFRYHHENFLCDVVIVTAERLRVPAHSIILASVSSKLRAAFQQSSSANIRKNYVFRLQLRECEAAVVEILLQFVYTGTIVPFSHAPIDVNGVLLAGQKLGLDPVKIAGCLGAMLHLSGLGLHDSLPYVVNDEDIMLEIVERGSDLSADVERSQPIEIIKVTSKLRTRKSAPNSDLDHSYTNDSPNNNNKNRKNVRSENASRSSVAGAENASEMSSVSEHLRLVNEAVEEEEAAGCKSEEEGAGDLGIVPDRRLGACEEEGYIDNVENQAYSVTYEAEFVQADGPGQEVRAMGSDGVAGGGVYVKQESLLQETSQDEENFIRDVLARTMGGEGAEDAFVPGCVGVDTAYPGNGAGIVPGNNKRGGRRGPRGKPFVGRGRSKLVRAKVIHTCDMCPKSFRTYPEYADHHRTHTGEKPYVCDICGKAFGRSYTATEHRRLHTGERPYQCDTCGKRFTTAGDLGKHRRLHTGEKPYKCPICGKEMSTGRENADHRRLHAGGNVCPVCGKTFTRLHNMKEHINGTHAGVKRHTCPVCAKTFAYSCSLRYHKRLHEDERAIKCETCGKCFARFGELSRHERNAHKTTTTMATAILEIDVGAAGITFAN